MTKHRTLHNAIKHVHTNISTIMSNQPYICGALEFTSLGHQTVNAYELFWNTHRAITIDMYENHMAFKSWNVDTYRWMDVCKISYDITREEFDQLLFVHDLRTLEFKSFKYLKLIKEHIFS